MFLQGWRLWGNWSWRWMVSQGWMSGSWNLCPPLTWCVWRATPGFATATLPNCLYGWQIISISSQQVRCKLSVNEHLRNVIISMNYILMIIRHTYTYYQFLLPQAPADIQYSNQYESAIPTWQQKAQQKHNCYCCCSNIWNMSEFSVFIFSSPLSHSLFLRFFSNW